MKQINFPISVEKFAAYLDGNLSLDESMDVCSILESDDKMKEILEVNERVDNLLNDYIDMGIEPDMSIFQKIPTIDSFSDETFDVDSLSMHNTLNSLELFPFDDFDTFAIQQDIIQEDLINSSVNELNDEDAFLLDDNASADLTPHDGEENLLF